MKVCIFGIGRSGTSSLYSLLQHIMSDQLEEDVDFVYEPFLWDRGTFNASYATYRKNFPRVDSLSAEGIYFHQQIPMFLANPGEFRSHPFLASLTSPREKKKHLLLKAIRANGRFESWCLSDPDVKFIFAIRNPIDVVNSNLRLFSFFGSDFHRDDSDRFAKEVSALYGESPAMSSEVEKSASYWECMNRFVAERHERYRNRVLVVPHELYLHETDRTLEKMCSFLDLAYRSSYLTAAKTRVGVVTKKLSITADDFSYLRKVSERYPHFLALLGCRDVDDSLYLRKYENVPFRSTTYSRPFAGLTTMALQKEISNREGHKAEVSAVRDDLRQTKDTLLSREREVSRMEKETSALNNKILALTKHSKNLESRLDRAKEENQKHSARIGQLEGELIRIRDSWSYRIGRLLLSPIVLLAQTFSKRSG